MDAIALARRRAAREAAAMGGRGEGVEGVAAPTGGKQKEEETVLRFRNYIPRDEDLPVVRLAKPELPKEESVLAALLRAAREAEGGDESASRASSLLPKKANWDLKRDVQRKLERLERGTQRSILAMMRDRIAQESGEAGDENGDKEDDAGGATLLTAMGAAERAGGDSDMSDVD